MRKAWLILPVLLLFSAPAICADEKGAAPSPPAFLAEDEKNLEPLDAVYEDLESEKLPLMDEAGQPVGHRPLENRRQALSDLRHTLEQLRADPGNLVSVTTLFIQSESLADDLYDLSQVAYDNDREELGRRLAELVTRLDAQRDAIETYTLSLATEKEERIRKLESENGNLRQDLKRVLSQRSSNPAHN